MSDIPDKLYFRMNEAATLCGVESYVLRFWENAFGRILKPKRSDSGQRWYTKKNIETARQIKHLLYVERFTLKGAKRQLTVKSKSPQA
jgi:DNA-binding transcriptional MerR regulator